MFENMKIFELLVNLEHEPGRIRNLSNSNRPDPKPNQPSGFCIFAHPFSIKILKRFRVGLFLKNYAIVGDNQNLKVG